MVSSSFVPSFTVFSLSHCANMFCVRPAAAGADAANALCALLVLPECVGRFRFMVYFCRYYSRRHALLSHTSPQGNHFALTEQITNFVIFRSFHFVSFRLLWLWPTGAFLKQPPSMSIIICAGSIASKIWFSFCRVGFVHYVAYLPGFAICVLSSGCLCLCVCARNWMLNWALN